MGCAFRPGPRRCTAQCEIRSENHGGGRGCTGTGHRKQSKLHSPRQGRVMDARNKSPPTAANMSWVSGQTERPKDGNEASGTDRTFSDFRRSERYQEHIWGAVLGAPHLARGVGATHRAKHGAICVGAEQRYTNGCPCCGTRCVMSKTVSCSSRSRTLCAGVPVRSNVNALMSCVLSVVVCKSVGNLCVYDC